MLHDTTIIVKHVNELSLGIRVRIVNQTLVSPKAVIHIALLLMLAFLLNFSISAQMMPSQKAIADAALSLVGRQTLNFNDRHFVWDCSGTVLASLYIAGLDVRSEYGSYNGNGVTRLYEIARHHQIEYDLPLPEIGDIIFWDNTYDKNEDLKWNDLLTHTGIVVDVKADGTVTYVHHDYRRGIVTAEMNLLYSDNREATFIDGTKRVINSPLRMNKDRYLNPSKWLSGQLFRSFGRFHVLLDEINPKADVEPAPKSK